MRMTRDDWARIAMGVAFEEFLTHPELYNFEVFFPEPSYRSPAGKLVIGNSGDEIRV
jgi:hypothetical protein